MPHCTKCGAAMADNGSFCPVCGASQAAAPVVHENPAPVSGGSTEPQMAENTAALLSYVLGWVTGLIFYFIDKRPYVRFHAAQSIVVFGGLNVITILLGMVFGMSLMAGGMAGFSMGFAIYRIVDLAAFVLWILLMIKAYQGQRFRVPIAADLADKFFGKS